MGIANIRTLFADRVRSLYFAKPMQTSGKRACSQLSECSLAYAKLTQTSGKRACSQLSECSLAYAKLHKKSRTRSDAHRKAVVCTSQTARLRPATRRFTEATCRQRLANAPFCVTNPHNPCGKYTLSAYTLLYIRKPHCVY